MTANAFIVFLSEHLEPWLKKHWNTCRVIIIFMQDNALLLVVHKTKEYLQQLSFLENELTGQFNRLQIKN